MAQSSEKNAFRITITKPVITRSSRHCQNQRRLAPWRPHAHVVGRPNRLPHNRQLFPFMYLTSRQLSKMGGNPDMTLLLCHYFDTLLHDAGYPNIEIRSIDPVAERRELAAMLGADIAISPEELHSACAKSFQAGMRASQECAWAANDNWSFPHL